MVRSRRWAAVHEALALEPRDVDLDADTLRVRHGKGDRSRTVGLDDGTQALLARWLDRRQRLGVNGRRRLFCKLDGGPLDQSYVRHLLRRLAEKQGSSGESIRTRSDIPTRRSSPERACR